MVRNVSGVTENSAGKEERREEERVYTLRGDQEVDAGVQDKVDSWDGW